MVGEAQEEVRPDVADLRLNVTDDRPSSGDAESENARLTTAVVDGLKASGVDVKDIATLTISLSPIIIATRQPSEFARRS